MPAPTRTADVEVGQLFRDDTGWLVVFEVYDPDDWVDAIDTDGEIVPLDNFQELLDSGVLEWAEVWRKDSA